MSGRGAMGTWTGSFRPGPAKVLPVTTGECRGRAGGEHRGARGEIFGFLGPNGAGKTTTLRMLTTLLPIDAGTATVVGLDVGRQPKQVRERIGFVSQLGGADVLATGRENLSSRAASTASTGRGPDNGPSSS